MQRYFPFILLCLFLFCSCIKCEKNDVQCELAAFMENLDGTEKTLIDSGPVITVNKFKSCKESTEECANEVENQAIVGTNGGNLTLPVDEKNGYTVGDVLCDKADVVEENVRHKRIHIYWRLCGSPWKPTSFKMSELLCCEDGLYVPCHKLKTEL